MSVDRNSTSAAVSWRRSGSYLLLVLAGPVDLSAASGLDAFVRFTEAEPGPIVVDLAEVTFFGATGLNLLARLAARNRSVLLVSVPGQLPIGRALRVVRLEHLVTIVS